MGQHGPGDHVSHMQAKEPVVTPQHWELEGARAFTDSLASGSWMADKLVRSRIPMHGATSQDPSRSVFTIGGGATSGNLELSL